MSSIGRLFEYARVTTVDPRQNYTTQALAEVIRRDPVPMVAALRFAGLLDADPDIAWRIQPNTQSSFRQPTFGTETSTYRYVDLVLGAEAEARRLEVWLEIKVYAGLHGDQLERYAEFIRLNADEVERKLAILSPEPVPTETDVVQIRWQAVADAVSDTSTRNEAAFTSAHTSRRSE